MPCLPPSGFRNAERGRSVVCLRTTRQPVPCVHARGELGLEFVPQQPTHMCLAVYVAADAPLPESRWNEHAPSFYLESIPESAGVRRQFRHAHVYYAGSHEGCGCGFFKRGRDGEELEQRQQNYRALASVLAPRVGAGADIQLFTCWEGDLMARPETTEVITLPQLLDPGFELRPLSLITVCPDARGCA